MTQEAVTVEETPEIIEEAEEEQTDQEDEGEADDEEPEQPNNQDEDTWYLALRPLLLPQGPGVKPSSIRFKPGQRFALDGDEPIDLDSLLSTRAVKLYEESDAEWAQAQLGGAEPPTPNAAQRRRGKRGKN